MHGWLVTRWNLTAEKSYRDLIRERKAFGQERAAACWRMRASKGFVVAGEEAERRGKS